MNGLVLVGFMATGKTTVGKELSRRLHWLLVDTDDCIEAAAGKSISRIFAEDGEAVFRDWETRILRKLGKQTGKPRVISTGGGIVLADRNWPLLRALGAVICLTASEKEIRKRTGKSQKRPLLAGSPAEVEARIADLLERRQTAYAKAHWMCSTDGKTPKQIAAEILAWRHA